MHHLCRVFRELYALVDIPLSHHRFQQILIEFFFLFSQKIIIYLIHIFIKIIAWILVVDPTRRPSVHDILNSPIVKAHMNCLPWNETDSDSIPSNPTSPALPGNDGGRRDDSSSYGRSQASDVSSQSLPPQMVPKFELAAPLHAPKMKKDMKDVSMRIMLFVPSLVFLTSFNFFFFFF
jgi:hypothetical protein